MHEKGKAELVYEFPVEPDVLATIVRRSAAETTSVSARADRERISLWVPSLLSPYGTKFEGKVEPTERGSVLRGTLRRSVVLRLQVLLALIYFVMVIGMLAYGIATSPGISAGRVFAVVGILVVLGILAAAFLNIGRSIGHRDEALIHSFFERISDPRVTPAPPARTPVWTSSRLWLPAAVTFFAIGALDAATAGVWRVWLLIVLVVAEVGLVLLLRTRGTERSLR